MAAILKASLHNVRNPTQSNDAYLLEEQLCQSSTRSDNWAFGFFEEFAPTKRTK